MDPNGYNCLEPYLQQICCSIVNDDKEHFNSFNEFLDFFRQDLESSDYIFKHFRGVQCTGSYLHKNYIGYADEFDMNLTIKFPMDYNDVIIERCSDFPGFIKINIKKQAEIIRKSTIAENFKSILNWVGDDGYILQNNFRQWMESVMMKTLNNHNINGNVVVKCNNSFYNIKSFQKSGPAYTLKVQKLNSNIQFSIDLVPVLIFKSNLPHINLTQFKNKDWYAVAKPFNQDVGGEMDKLWRLSFPLQEDEIWDGKNFMKPTCRLLKQIRDNEMMPYIASYYINTIILTMDRDNPGIFTSTRSLSFIFISALNLFLKMITNKTIPYLWIQNLNLLQHLSSSQIQDCQIKLNCIIQKINTCAIENPSDIYKILFPK